MKRIIISAPAVVLWTTVWLWRHNCSRDFIVQTSRASFLFQSLTHYGPATPYVNTIIQMRLFDDMVPVTFQIREIFQNLWWNSPDFLQRFHKDWSVDCSHTTEGTQISAFEVNLSTPSLLWVIFTSDVSNAYSWLRICQFQVSLNLPNKRPLNTNVILSSPIFDR